MSNKNENRASKRSDIYHELAQIIPDWKSFNERQLLEKYWKLRNYVLNVRYDNSIANNPEVVKKKSTITFNVCQKHQERRIQLARALINSCRGVYDNLPNLHSSDDDLMKYRPTIISESEATEAMEFLQKLSSS